MRRSSLVLFVCFLSLLLLLRPVHAADECNADDFLEVLKDVTKKVVLTPTTTAAPTTTTTTTATTTTTTTAEPTTTTTTTAEPTTTTTSTAAKPTTPSEKPRSWSKRAERANPLSGCLTVTSKESGEFVSVGVNCAESDCINFAATLPPWFESLDKNCGDDQKKKLAEAADVVKGITDLSKLCDECQMNFANLKRLESNLEESECKTSTNCSESCLLQWKPFLELWDNTSLACKASAGAISLAKEMISVATFGETVVLMCNPVCNSTTAENSVTSWFQQWQTAVDENCISLQSPDVNLIFDSYSLDEQCAESCKSSINGILDAYKEVPSVCQKGLVDIHFHDLGKSISDSCDSWLPEFTTTQVFFGVIMGIIGLGLTYCVCGSCYRRFRLKKKGWEIIPPFRFCQKKSTQRPRRKRNLSDDEEVILFDAEEIDDDHL